MSAAPARTDPPPAAGAAVAVVIPCYKQAHLLGDAIESVLQQTYPVAECTVVDDGSPDDVPAVVRRFPGVRLLRQRNRGLSAARNVGLRATTAELVTFLDSDDVLFPGGIAAGVAALEACPDCAFAAGGYRERRVDGTMAADRYPVIDEPAYVAMLRSNFIRMHGAVLYRRSVLARAGGFRESLTACEDYDAYLRLLRGGSVALHPGIVAEYRRQPESLTSQQDRMFVTALAALRAQASHARSEGHLWAAYRDGLTYVRELHGEFLVAQVHAGVRSPRAWPAAARALVRLASLDGRHYASRFARALVRRTLGRPPEARRSRVPHP